MRLTVLAIVGAGAVGCTNARDEYVDFGDRLPDAGPGIDAEIVSEIPDISGDFFMVSRANLTEDRFLKFRVTLTYTAVTANTGVLAYSGYCLDVDTDEPVGEPLSADGVEVRADATFDAPLVGTLAAECNSVTGTQIESDGLIHGQIISADFGCGTMSGNAGGLPLDGTTWATQRITGETLPSAIWRCEDAPRTMFGR